MLIVNRIVNEDTLYAMDVLNKRNWLTLPTEPQRPLLRACHDFWYMIDGNWLYLEWLEWYWHLHVHSITCKGNECQREGLFYKWRKTVAKKAMLPSVRIRTNDFKIKQRVKLWIGRGCGDTLPMTRLQVKWTAEIWHVAGCYLNFSL